MRWERDEADARLCDARSGYGMTNHKLKREGQEVSLYGRIEDCREIYDLVVEAQSARERRKSLLAGEKIGYFIHFAGPGGFSTMHIELAAPGIQTFKDLMGVQASLSKQLGGDALILDWRELDRGSVLIQAPGPVPVAANQKP